MTTTTGTISSLMFGEFHSPADGISASTRTVTVLHPDGRQAPTDTRPGVRLVTRPQVTALRGVTMHHFEPATGCPPDRVGFMASGAWVVIDSPTARALNITPAAYPLHDRSETPARYAALSE
jgi:hypothetical protein